MPTLNAFALFGESIRLLSALAVLSVGSTAQTTQGLIAGTLSDDLTGEPIAAAEITIYRQDGNFSRKTFSADSGFFVVPLLSPGTYRLRAKAAGFQTLEWNNLELGVAARLSISIALRQLNDVWEKNQPKSVFLPGGSVLQLYGPDVDATRTADFDPQKARSGTLESTVSEVIQDRELVELPLENRDAYALLVTLPGVTSDLPVTRGLGLSVNGQRSTSSNYMVDGFDNNNHLTTGPLAVLAPDAIAEYRISTNNFSPEYGGASGYIANVASRAGGAAWHGLAYYYFGNRLLDANDFQRNWQGLGRPPDQSNRPGFFIGGPVRKLTLFVSGAFEYFHFQSTGESEQFILPGAAFHALPGSFAARVLAGYQPPPGSGMTVTVTDALPSSLNQYVGLPRLDWTPAGSRTSRVFLRVPVSLVTHPDFLFSPYKQYSSPLTDRTFSPGASWLLEPRPSLTNELRVGWSQDTLVFDRAHPDVPVLTSADGTTLPGSPYLYGFRNRTRSWQALDGMVLAHERHTFSIGAGMLERSVSGYLSTWSSGYYAFECLQAFQQSQPYLVQLSLSRQALDNGSYAVPNFNRSYRIASAYAYAQDSFRVSSHLVLNGGLRFDHPGSPVSTGSVPDGHLVLGSGVTIDDQVHTAMVTYGDKSVYRANAADWSGRFGFSYAPGSDSQTLIRGAWGIFYDQPFDNLWLNLRNNSSVLASTFYSGPVVTPIGAALPMLGKLEADTELTKLYLFAPHLNDPRVESYFLGVEHRLGRAWTLDVNLLGSRSGNLIASDILNRDYAVPSVAGQNPFGRVNANLPNIIYRSNLGLSRYNAMSVSAVYRSSPLLLRASWTWSHSIDNQSDPLAGDYYDLNFTGIGQAPSAPGTIAAFSTELNTQIDRGNSDFDQRHDLAAAAIWDLPDAPSRWRTGRFFRNWKAAQLMAVRSGFPFTVYSSGYTGKEADQFQTPTVENRRADLVDLSLVMAPRTAVTGGVQLLNAAAFVAPTAFRQGTSGRNAFAGPGSFSLDLSLSRTFSLAGLRESCKLVFRADAYNFLNHTNLGPPVSDIFSSQFGQAQFGVGEQRTVFPALTPFMVNPRHIQLALRLEF